MTMTDPRETAGEARPAPEPLSVLEHLIRTHTRSIQHLTEVLHDDVPPGYEIVNLSSTDPTATLQTISAADPVAGIAILNTEQVAVTVGWAGNRAINGGGVPVPAGSYLVLPINTNVVDVSASASSITADVQITVVIFKLKKTPRLSAGSLGGSSGGGVVAVTSESPRSVTVGAASAQVLPANISRKGLQFVNSSANAISLGLGQAAVLGDDIWLAAGGGAWDGTISGRLWLGSIFAIAAGAGSNLAVVEV